MATQTRWFPGLILLPALAVGLLLPSLVAAQDKGSTPKSSPKVLAAFHDVVAKPCQSTVRIQCEGKDVALGTIVAADGWIVTKASELKEHPVCKLHDGRVLEAQVVGIQEKFDLALLKIDAKDLKPIDWLESKKAPVGNWVASPGVDETPVAIGVVSVATRDIPLRGAGPNPTSGFLGVGVDAGEGGAKIIQIVKDSGAEKAGLKVNDVILTISGKAVGDQETLSDTLQVYKPGDILSIKIKRGDKDLEIKATLGKRPAGRGDFQNNMGSELSTRRTGFPKILQHDSVLKPHDCGGPLVDLDGKAIGINIARGGRTESYAVPTEAVLALLPELKSGKLAPLAAKKPASERIAEARSALEKLESEKSAVEKKLAEARALLQKVETEKSAAEKKLAEARAALEKAMAEEKAEKKEIKDGK